MEMAMFAGNCARYKQEQSFCKAIVFLATALGKERGA
jgi:hypothetical protein